MTIEFEVIKKASSSNGRLGRINRWTKQKISGLPNLRIRKGLDILDEKLPLGRGGCHTPNTLIYSRFGHVPHLTRDVFDAHLAPYSDHGSSLLYQIPLGPM